MKIRVDRDRCAGHAVCSLRAPDLFLLDEDGFCISDGVEVPPGREEDARAVEYSCPERAISLAV
jgi:ferredoxin